jgi:hypothetical protein
VKVERFEAEADAIERFVAVGERVLGAIPGWQSAARPDVAPLLEKTHPLQRGRAGAGLLVSRDGVDVGRAFVALAPELDDEPGDRVGRTGLLGMWAVDHDVPGAPEALLEEAFVWLKQRGARRVLGPMNLSTWYGHRFVTQGHDKGPFLLEHACDARDAGSWERAGFVPRREYVTLRIPHARVPFLDVARRRAERDGVRFSPLEEADPESMLALLYDVSRRAFGGKTAYADVPLDEFRRLYGDAGALLLPGLSWVARAPDGAPLAFLFAYPDLLEGAPPSSTVLKTMAVARGAPGYLGWALARLHVEGARALGFTHGRYALMEKWRELLHYATDPRRMDGELGEIDKRYALYQRAL